MRWSRQVGEVVPECGGEDPPPREDSYLFLRTVGRSPRPSVSRCNCLTDLLRKLTGSEVGHHRWKQETQRHDYESTLTSNVTLY